VFGHPGAGRPTVLADVLVACAPDPGFQVDRRVLVKRGELSPLGLGHQQPLGVIEDREKGRIHLSSSIPRKGTRHDQVFPASPAIEPVYSR
jgi:hypothetical protein